MTPCQRAQVVGYNVKQDFRMYKDCLFLVPSLLYPCPIMLIFDQHFLLWFFYVPKTLTTFSSWLKHYPCQHIGCRCMFNMIIIMTIEIMFHLLLKHSPVTEGQSIIANQVSNSHLLHSSNWCYHWPSLTLQGSSHKAEWEKRTKIKCCWSLICFHCFNQNHVKIAWLRYIRSL